MSTSDEVLYYLHRAKARVEGDAVVPPERADAVRYTREQLEAALPHAHAGAEVPDGARLKPLKVAALGAMRPVTSSQGEFNHAVLRALDSATEAVEQLAQRVEVGEQHANRIQAGIATGQLTVDDLVDDLRTLRRDVAELTDAVAELRTELAAGRADHATLHSRQDVILRTARDALEADGYRPDQLAELAGHLDTDAEELRDALADHLHGSRDEVKAQLAPHLDVVRATPVGAPVLDVGCGRGEWLELLRDAEIDASGVSPAATTVRRCRDLGLDVTEADAVDHLRGLEANSLRAVTAFGVAEHLGVDALVALVDAALAALVPGGALVVETPNPTNVTVGAADVYRDPAAVRPLHPQLLQFLVARRGFADVEVRYLNPTAGPHLSADDLAPNGELARSQALAERIDWALAGPTDFCVVGTKPAPGP